MSRLKPSKENKKQDNATRSVKKDMATKQNHLSKMKKRKSRLKHNNLSQEGTGRNEIAQGEQLQNRLTKTDATQTDATTKDNIQNDIKQNESEEKQKAVRVRKPSRYRKLVAKTGKTRILVYGKNSVRAAHAISKTYRVENIVNKKEGVEFSVQSKHCDKIIALLDNLCYSYKIVKVYGILPKSLLILSRAGLFVGLALAIVAMCVYPTFITRVSVNCIGDVTLNESTIDDILSSFGISEGGKVYKADIDGARYGLLALDRVTFASIERCGTHFKVTIKAVDDDILADIAGSSVVAKKQAVVERIIVESGTAVKKYGDVVKPGDVLIDGYIEYGDEKIPVQASGYAYGKVYYKKSVFFPDTIIKKSYGQEKTVTKLSMFGKTPKAPKSPFEQFECEVSVAQFGFLLPFEIYTYTFYEVSVEETTNTLSEEDMQNAVYAQIVEEFSMNCKVLDRIFDVERNDNGYTVSVTVETEELI